MDSGARRRIRIWDAPTRLFHWSLVGLIAAAWWTAEEEMLEWHQRIGLTILILIVFRLIWGLIGGSTARFSGFVRGPRAIAAYLRGRAPHAIGHNPLGALSVLALLFMVAAVTALGLFTEDEDGIAPGPLAYRVSADVSETAHEWHEQGFDLLLVLVGLHVAAILYYALFRRDNLVGPMISGSRAMPEGTEGMRPAPAWRALLALILAIGVGWWVWSGA
jgi:cytochrome b